MTAKNIHQNAEEIAVHKTEQDTTGSETTTEKDPTDRWSQRVRAMSSGKHPKKYTATTLSDESEPCCPLRVDIEALAEAAEKCIAKRPLTSMVIAATAGAAVTALFAALVGTSGKKNRR